MSIFGKLKLKLKLKYGFIAVSFMIILYIGHWSTEEISSKHVSYKKDKTGGVHFAVITQTEECLSSTYLSQTYFRNGTFCQCHVYVVSFRKPCTHNTSPHIHYIYNSTVGWTEGRNIGYTTAKNYYSESYLYYIFLDDDVKLQFNYNSPRVARYSKIPPLKAFMNFLLESLPAIAVPNCENHYLQYCPENIRSSLYFRSYKYDAIFNAFHRDVVHTLLPYNSKYEKKSFWLSQLYLIMKTFVMYYGQLVRVEYVRVKNAKHRSYPRGHIGDRNITSAMVNEIKSEIPMKYRNHSVFGYLDIVRLLIPCIPILEKRPSIVPFKTMYQGNELLLQGNKVIRTKYQGGGRA